MNNNTHIEDDDLKGFSNKNPYKIENNYFEKLNSNIQQRVEEFEELKSIAPILNNIPKYNSFEVPNDYFEDFPTRIQERIVNTKSSNSILNWLILLLKPRFAIPVLATIFIAISGINFMNKNAEHLQTEIATEEMTVDEQLYTIDESTVIESVVASNETFTSDENEIENYLIDNNIDETNLKNEL